MRLSLLTILLAASLSACSTAQLRGFGGNLVGSAVGLFAGSDDSAQPLSGGNHCDALCEQNRQLRSNRIAEEYYRLQALERKEETAAAFEAYMNDINNHTALPTDDLPIVIVDSSN